MSWKPADPAHWSMLGLADPDPRGELPPDATTADVFAYGLVPRGAGGPVEGILEGVRAELEVVRLALDAPPLDAMLEMLSRRLYAAIVLLRRTDQRDPIPEVMRAGDEAPPNPAPPEAEGHTTTPAPAPFSIDDEPTANHGTDE